MIELTLAEDIPEIAKSGDTVLLKDDGQFEIKKADGTIIQKPFANYKDFADCVSKNKDKENPNAYCGSIKHKIEDEVNKSNIEKDDKISHVVRDYADQEEREEKDKDKSSKEKNIEKTFDAWLDSKGIHRRDYELRPKDNQDKLIEEYNESQKRKKEETKKEYDPRIEKYLSIDKEKSWQILTKFYNAGHLDSYKVLKDFINKVATCPDVTEKFEKIMDGWMKDGEADTSSIEKIIDSCKQEGGNIVREGNDKNTKINPIGKSVEIIETVTKSDETELKHLKNMMIADPSNRTEWHRKQIADLEEKIKNKSH